MFLARRGGDTHRVRAQSPVCITRARTSRAGRPTAVNPARASAVEAIPRGEPRGMVPIGSGSFCLVTGYGLLPTVGAVIGNVILGDEESIDHDALFHSATLQSRV